MDFLQSRAALQLLLCALTPVVEVTRHKKRRFAGHFFFYQCAEGLQLRAALILPQTQVDTNGMEIQPQGGRPDHTMQQTASLVLTYGNVDVVVGGNWKLGQECIAVVTIAVDSIASIGELRPDGV